jgi:hypothetical protein
MLVVFATSVDCATGYTLHMFKMGLSMEGRFHDVPAHSHLSEGEMIQTVRPHQPILAEVGTKRVIAFYAPGNTSCDLRAVTWKSEDAEAHSAIGIRISLTRGQTAHIDSVDNKSITLRCGDQAEALTAADGNPDLAASKVVKTGSPLSRTTLPGGLHQTGNAVHVFTAYFGSS